MSHHSSIRHFLTIAFALTSTSVAFARRPPALLDRQERAERAFAACPVHPTEAGSGYRDMLVRFPWENWLRPAKASVPAAAVDQLALACPIGATLEAVGYRDMLVRFSHVPSNVQVARLSR